MARVGNRQGFDSLVLSLALGGSPCHKKEAYILTVLIESPIPPKHFGKDHWSLLAYVGHRTEESGDGVGKLALERLRCNEQTHPLLVGPIDGRWKDTYTTRLRDGESAGHDDWDCLDDLEAAGLVSVVSCVNALVALTPEGHEAYQMILELEEFGGQWHQVHWPPLPLKPDGSRSRNSTLAK
jgi:hypothetical protein